MITLILQSICLKLASVTAIKSATKVTEYIFKASRYCDLIYFLGIARK